MNNETEKWTDHDRLIVEESLPGNVVRLFGQLNFFQISLILMIIIFSPIDNSLKNDLMTYLESYGSYPIGLISYFLLSYSFLSYDSRLSNIQFLLISAFMAFNLMDFPANDPYYDQRGDTIFLYIFIGVPLYFIYLRQIKSWVAKKAKSYKRK